MLNPAEGTLREHQPGRRRANAFTRTGASCERGYEKGRLAAQSIRAGDARSRGNLPANRDQRISAIAGPVRGAPPCALRDRSVVGLVNGSRTQNGHIRNDTRDVSRRIATACNSQICRRKCVASDRACTRVTLQNLHGKEAVPGSSPGEGLKPPLSGGFCVFGFLLPQPSA